jgi:hypothetical protein
MQNRGYVVCWVGRVSMQRGKRGLPAWQVRWVALHDDLHLLEVLLEAITPAPEHTAGYWALSADVITFGEDLREAYERDLAANGRGEDAAYQALRRRLTTLQARAQILTLENEVG